VSVRFGVKDVRENQITRRGGGKGSSDGRIVEGRELWGLALNFE